MKRDDLLNVISICYDPHCRSKGNLGTYFAAIRHFISRWRIFSKLKRMVAHSISVDGHSRQASNRRASEHGSRLSTPKICNETALWTSYL